MTRNWVLWEYWNYNSEDDTDLNFHLYLTLPVASDLPRGFQTKECADGSRVHTFHECSWELDTLRQEILDYYGQHDGALFYDKHQGAFYYKKNMKLLPSLGFAEENKELSANLNLLTPLLLRWTRNRLFPLVRWY